MCKSHRYTALSFSAACSRLSLASRRIIQRETKCPWWAVVFAASADSGYQMGTSRYNINCTFITKLPRIYVLACRIVSTCRLESSSGTFSYTRHIMQFTNMPACRSARAYTCVLYVGENVPIIEPLQTLLLHLTWPRDLAHVFVVFTSVHINNCDRCGP